MPFTINNLEGEPLVTADSAENLRDAVIWATKHNVILDRANLSEANLSEANLSEAVEQYAKVPSLHRRILAAIEAGGALSMDKWYTCETTHCRAGWAVHLAGPAGAILEACLGTAVAGALISIVSCPQLEGEVPDFFNLGNYAVLADIKRLADLEPPLENLA